MAEAIEVDAYRKRKAAHNAGAIVMAPIAYIAIGDGGHNPDNTAKSANSSATALNHEVLRKPLASIIQEDEFSSTGIGVIDADEIPGGVISEAALYDANNYLVCIKNFPAKYLEEGETYSISLKQRF